MRPLAHIGDIEDQFQVGIADVELGRSTGNSGIKFDRCFSLESLMRPEIVIPGEIETKLMAQVGLSHGHYDAPGAFGLQGTDHSLDDGNASIFPDGPEAGLDFPASAPAFEGFAPELAALVGDDVFRCLPGSADGSAEEGTDLEGIGLAVEYGKADDFSGEVVDHHGDPISERPALGQREREPGSPEAGGSRDKG